MCRVRVLQRKNKTRTKTSKRRAFSGGQTYCSVCPAVLKNTISVENSFLSKSCSTVEESARSHTTRARVHAKRPRHEDQKVNAFNNLPNIIARVNNFHIRHPQNTPESIPRFPATS